MKTHQHQIAIIGAGTAGVTVAAQLRLKNKNLDIALIDPADTHYYQAAWTLVGAGTFDFEKTARPMESVIPKGVKWIKEAVDRIDADHNTIKLASGDHLNYEYLVVCPGLIYDYDMVEGLRGTMNKNNVCSNYTDSKYTWEVLRNFKGGNAIFTQAATPVKCGGAPQKIMYLAADYFRKKGIDKKTNISFPIPGSVIFGVPVFAKTIMKVVDRYGIELRFFHKLTRIDAEKRQVHYTITAESSMMSNCFYALNPDIKDLDPSERNVILEYDMLHLAPPQVAPYFVQESKLAVQDGPNKGWVDVNINTLQHTQYSNVFSLGDVAALPTAKTGAAVRKQAPVVVENLLHVINEEGKLSEGYHGYSSCPLVTGYGKMVLAEFGYDNVRMSDPLISKFVDTTKEQWSMWLLKKYGLPFMYWNLMLKGRA